LVFVHAGGTKAEQNRGRAGMRKPHRPGLNPDPVARQVIGSDLK